MVVVPELDLQGDLAVLVHVVVVLAALLVRANQQVAVGSLCDAVWQKPPACPASDLRTYAAGLRRRFRDIGEHGARLVSRNGFHTLIVHPGESDLFRFDTHVHRGERALRDADPVTAVDEFHRALSLWRGRPSEDCSVGPAPQGEIALPEDRRPAVVESSAKVRIELGEGAAIVGELRRVLVDHPFREELWAHLMVALSQCGRRAGALEVFGEARRRLVEELGIEPGPRLCGLQRRILSGEAVAARRPRRRGRPVAVLRRRPASTGNTGQLGTRATTELWPVTCCLRRSTL